jgi:hypothetical protein
MDKVILFLIMAGIGLIAAAGSFVINYFRTKKTKDKIRYIIVKYVSDGKINTKDGTDLNDEIQKLI